MMNNPENLQPPQTEEELAGKTEPSQPETLDSSTSEGSESGDSQEVLEKTEQSIRILSDLWEKRFEVLDQYYKERNKKRFIPFKSDASIQSETVGLLSQLAPINVREEKVIEILERGAVAGTEILQGASQPTESSSEIEDEAVVEFNNKIGLVNKILQRYSEVVSSHKDILKIEKELIGSPDESKFELYLKRMDLFSSEFEILDQGEIEGLKEYFSEIDSDLQKIEEAIEQNKPLEHLQRSLVSAVVRVAVSNIAAGLVVGNPFANPYFWQLTAATVPSVLMVNYIDYYFKAFTKLTDKISRLARLQK